MRRGDFRRDSDRRNRRDGGGGGRQGAMFKVDREQVCPMLLRVFVSETNRHQRPSGFSLKGENPGKELQIHTWMDCSLRELTTLIQAVYEPAAAPTKSISFAIMYPDSRGAMVDRTLGKVHSTRAGAQDSLTLQELRFEIGDFVDVAIM